MPSSSTVGGKPFPLVDTRDQTSFWKLVWQRFVSKASGSRLWRDRIRWSCDCLPLATGAASETASWAQLYSLGKLVGEYFVGVFRLKSLCGGVCISHQGCPPLWDQDQGRDQSYKELDFLNVKRIKWKREKTQSN